ncbi:MAG TPA: glycosyltransferase [Terriglobia bacterium]|nr:glycosyltransferase [Terriglobia bacterium]
MNRILMPELVSCILATRNRGAFVRQAIRCFQRQTYDHSELIVVDDGEEPVAGLCCGLERVRYIRLHHRTPLGKKLNIGVCAADGTILQKLDDDDYYAPDFLERAVGALASGNPQRTVVAWCCFLVLLPGEDQLRHSGHNWASGGSLCFRPELWRRGPFRDLPGPDSVFLKDHQPNLVRVCAPESFLVVRHGQNTWTQWGGETVDQYFHRLPIYSKPLDALVDPQDLPFYRSLQRLPEPGAEGSRSPVDASASGETATQPLTPGTPSVEVLETRGAVGPAPVKDQVPLNLPPDSVSVVIISHNEGEHLRRTVDSLSPTLPVRSEIIIVDDGSTDQSTDFLRAGYDHVTLLRPAERLGVARARNFGGEHARGQFLVFSDAHVAVPRDWLAPLVAQLQRPEVGAVAPATSVMRPTPVESTGYGQKWRDASLGVEWLGRQSPEPHPVPLLCGCFLAMRRDVFAATGGFDSGMIVWGSEDAELSLRLWTLGYQCWVVPGVDVEHYFRPRYPYEVTWEPVLHNKLRLANVHFGVERRNRVVERLKQYKEFRAANERLAAGDVATRASTLRGLRRYDDDWFFHKFKGELQCELSGLDSAGVEKPESKPVSVSASGGDLVSACLLSWKRPQNLKIIVRELSQLEFIDEILVWNNNPSVRLEFSNRKTRVIECSENQSCYGRFLCAAQARNPVVYVQDDDALNLDVAGLYRDFLRDPTKIAHALTPYHWNQRQRRVYDDVQVALLGWGAFWRREWLSVLHELPPSIREDSLFRREADKFFTLLLERRHNTVLGDITPLDGHSTPGIALWCDLRYQQLGGLAVRQALSLLRLRKSPDLPVPWNVVIPCHNYGRYLGEAVESVLASDADYEITVVDDASSDETGEVGAGLAHRYPHVHYLRNEERRGPGCTRNRGIAAVESSFVVLLDADDRIGPDYLFEAGRLLSNGADVVNPDAMLFGAYQDRWVVPEVTTLQMLLQRNSVHCCSAFRRPLWSQTDGIDESMPCWMDYEFWIRLAAAGARIQGIHGDHYWYRQHEDSLSQSARPIQHELREYLRQKHASLYASG